MAQLHGVVGGIDDRCVQLIFRTNGYHVARYPSRESSPPLSNPLASVRHVSVFRSRSRTSMLESSMSATAATSRPSGDHVGGSWTSVSVENTISPLAARRPTSTAKVAGASWRTPRARRCPTGRHGTGPRSVSPERARIRPGRSVDQGSTHGGCEAPS
jgi:hypothetical protein